MARRAYVCTENFKPVNLPSGFTQIECIESTGTQYINTLLTANQNTRVEMEFSGWGSGEKGTSLFGARSAAGSADSFCLVLDSSSGRYRMEYGAANSPIRSGASFDDRSVVTAEKGMLRIGRFSAEVPEVTFSGANTLYLFGTNSAGFLSMASSVKVYWCRIHSGSSLVRNYIPCKNSDGVAGLYDLVDGVFYGNAGGGSFTAGTDVRTTGHKRGKKLFVGSDRAASGLPEGYNKMAYIEANGTQYINTAVTYSANNEYIMEARCQWTGSDMTYMGWDGGGQFGSSGNGLWHHGYGTPSAGMVSKNSFSTVTLKIQVGSSSNTVLDVVKDGESAATTTRTHGSLANYAKIPYPIFAVSGTSDISKYVSCKVAAFKIYVNSSVVRDFVPCLNPSGEAGLYDMVEGVFYGNAGTGNFSYEVTGFPDSYTRLEYIQSAGTQWIDTGVLGYATVSMEYKARLTGDTNSKNVLSEIYSDGGSSSVICSWRSANNKFQVCAGGSYQDICASDNLTHTIKFKQGSIVIDGTTYSIGGSAIATANIPLFAECYNSSPQAYGKFALYYAKFYNRGALVRDFVPCKNASGTVGLYDLVNARFYGNSGSGVFTAGWTAEALPVNTARYVKKGYVSIGKIARQFWGEQKVVYYGTAASLTEVCERCHAFSVGDHAVVAGGYGTEKTDAYTKDLVKKQLASLRYERYAGAGFAANSEYGIVVGGSSSGARDCWKKAEAYNKNLALLEAPELRTGVYSAAVAVLGEKIIIAGGRAYNEGKTEYEENAIEVYDKNMTRTSGGTMLYGRCYHFGASNRYAIFGNGIRGSSFENTVEAYTDMLTRVSAPSSDYYRGDPNAVSFRGMVIVAGGEKIGSNILEAYDNNLTKTVVGQLGGEYIYGLGVAAFDDHIVIGGGEDANGARTTVNVFDANFIRTANTGLSLGRYHVTAVRNRKHILFCGGKYGSSRSAVVDAYTLIDI